MLNADNQCVRLEAPLVLGGGEGEGFQAAGDYFDDVAFVAILAGETGVAEAADQGDKGSFADILEIHDVASGPGRYVVPGRFLAEFSVLAPEGFVGRN